MSSAFTAPQKIAVVLSTAVVLIFYAFLGYLWFLNTRVSDELAGRQWRISTDIYASPAGFEEPVLRIYGRDWRLTEPVLLEEMPQYVPNAFLAAEDERYRSHPGVDPVGVVRALVTNIRAGGIAQGGSTLNQQLIKSKFLSQDRTFRRKLVEIPLALLLDVRLTKDEILEAYLNEIYLGHIRGQPVLGINEAAKIYFNKRAEQLRLDEAALLAAIVRAPNRDTPDKRPELAKARRDAILRIMRQREWIGGGELAVALDRPVRFSPGRLPSRPYPYYLAALRSEMKQLLGEHQSRLSGLRILCELDPRMQLEAERAARNGVLSLRKRHSWIAAQSGSEPLQTAILSVDPRNGGVRALVGGSDFEATQLDRTRLMKRQPGSAFKPFAFAAAIDSRRYTTASLLLDSPLRVELASNQVWEPHNYDERYRGKVTLREAFEKSLNIPAVKVTQDLGVSQVARAVRRFGFDDEVRAVPALPLGVFEVSMRDLVAAYTVFPNLGERVEPHLLTEVHDSSGKRIYRREPERRRVLAPNTAYVIHTLLRGVVRRGTASRLRRYDLDHVAGKTGTTNDYRDAWFVGYTPNVVTAVWVGFDRGAALRLSSAEAALPIWGAYMRKVRTSQRELNPPEGVVFRNIDPSTETLWAEGCPGPFPEVFLDGTQPANYCPRGLLGSILRRVIFDAEVFDEPAAITFEKVRRWSKEMERNRKQMEGRLEKLRRIFGRDDEED